MSLHVNTSAALLYISDKSNATTVKQSVMSLCTVTHLRPQIVHMIMCVRYVTKLAMEKQYKVTIYQHKAKQQNVNYL